MNLSELKRRLEEFGISPKRSLGQNFLVSDTVIDRILEKVSSLNPELVVEIGPGVGALTESLLTTFSDRLLLMELDSELVQYWQSRGAQVVEGDALRYSWKDFVSKNQPVVLVSNLPYQISSSLVVELSSLGQIPFSEMILMFQKEVAERIMAKPKSKEYGIISVVAQNSWNISKVIDASARCFYPAPKISSRVLSFQIKADLYSSKSFLNFVKVGFQNRRKLLIKSLAALKTPKDWDWVEVLEGQGFDRNARAEELSPEQWKSLHLKYESGISV